MAYIMILLIEVLSIICTQWGVEISDFHATSLSIANQYIAEQIDTAYFGQTFQSSAISTALAVCTVGSDAGPSTSTANVQTQVCRIYFRILFALFVFLQNLATLATLATCAFVLCRMAH